MLYYLNDRKDVIATSETRPNSYSVSNTDLINYNFLYNDSPTAAGNAIIYN